MGKGKVINYRLVEEHSQTFNERLFLSYCKLNNKCIFESVNFHYKHLSMENVGPKLFSRKISVSLHQKGWQLSYRE